MGNIQADGPGRGNWRTYVVFRKRRRRRSGVTLDWWAGGDRMKRDAVDATQPVVLVVDDDTSLLKSTARLLRQLGYASVLFSSAEAFANHADFDGAVCILLDIDLGDGSGIELRRRLKEANISLPVIYMTGNDNPATREAAHRSGCVAYLT
jgi:CheY-like chemotaxis protein